MGVGSGGRRQGSETGVGGGGHVNVFSEMTFLSDVIFVLNRYFTWHFGYFESRGIQGPKPVPIFGTARQMMSQANMLFI